MPRSNARGWRPEFHGVLMGRSRPIMCRLPPCPVNPYSQYALARSTIFGVEDQHADRRGSRSSDLSTTAFAGFRLPCRRDSDTGHVAIAGAEPAQVSSRAHFLLARMRGSGPVPDAYRVQQSGSTCSGRIRGSCSESRAEVRYSVDGERARSWPHRQFGQSVRLRVPGGVGPVAVGAARVPGYRLGHVTVGVRYFASYIAALLLWFRSSRDCGIKGIHMRWARSNSATGTEEKCVPKP